MKSEGFEDFPFRITLPRRDFRRMGERQLLCEGRRMYADLQMLWRTELQMPQPDWEILASVSAQMKILEQGCPEVCRP